MIALFNQMQIIPDSTIDDFQYTIRDPEDPNPYLLLNYQRKKGKMFIDSLQGNLNWTVKVSESEIRNGLKALSFKKFVKRIVRYERQTDEGLEVSHKRDVKKAFAIELDRTFGTPEELDVSLNLLLLLCGTIIGSTVYE